MLRRKLVIFGAGIFGLSVAYACARRGMRVQVVDPGGIGAGSSGGIVGALAPHTPEAWNPKKAFQFQSLIMAESWWAEVAQVSGRDPGYARTGRVQPVADVHARDLAEARGVQAEALWKGKAVWQVVPAAEFGDWAPSSASGLVIHDTLSARLHPRQACVALAGAIRVLGGAIGPEQPAEGGLVVWATGAPGLARLGAELGYAVGAGVKGQAVLLGCDRREAPQLFAEGVHIIPHADGTVAIGSTSERDYADPTATDTQLDALLDRARALCPVLSEAPVLERWAGVRPRARSRAPMLGPHPLRPGEFIANGGFKIGFGVAPMVGEVMADLILEGVDRIPDGFRVTDNLPAGVGG